MKLKKLALAVCLALYTMPSVAEVTLQVGDVAPEIPAEAWLNEPFEGFEEGHFYVVEFWATWCGPCMAQVPHLFELHEHFEAENLPVHIIGCNAGESKEDLEAFLTTQQGQQMPYPIAVDTAERAVSSLWMQAAGQSGLPCTFIVDNEGRIAYIGHPSKMDAVLEQMIDGTWDSEWQSVLVSARAAILSEEHANQALQELANYIATNPDKRTTECALIGFKVLLDGRRYDAAFVSIQAWAQGNGAQEADALNVMAWHLMNRLPEEIDCGELPLFLLSQAIAADPLHWQAYDSLASYLAHKGAMEMALEMQEKAVTIVQDIVSEDHRLNEANVDAQNAQSSDTPEEERLPDYIPQIEVEVLERLIARMTEYRQAIPANVE